MADLEQSLGRPVVTFDGESVARFFCGKTVLITGAGGTIGADLFRQLLPIRASRLVLVDIDAETLHRARAQAGTLSESAAVLLATIDITERAALESLFAAERPGVVCHAAAQKHVPLAEDEPGPAVAINVLGTRHVADAATRNACDAFVLFNSDKAVDPASVMGVTKRLAEQYVQSLDAKTRFATVRCGNVIGFSGSVVPAFAAQITSGGPVVVTDPRMKRYFMTIAEAASLALLAATGSGPDEIYLMKMGSPVRILDLARAMIDESMAAGGGPI